MNIQSVTPFPSGQNTTIHAVKDSGENISFSYSHSFEMLHDPNKQGQWLDGQQLSLNEAIQFVISL